VVDVQDPTWPVIRHVNSRLPYSDTARQREPQAFFAIRAPTWDAKFGDDLPAYAAAVTEAGIPAGARVGDIGCGTRRALPALRTAVGPAGSVLALDLTAEMLQQGYSRTPTPSTPFANWPASPGVITPTTPRGRRISKARFPALAEFGSRPPRRLPSSADMRQ
jgi:hypothetical protein